MTTQHTNPSPDYRARTVEIATDVHLAHQRDQDLPAGVFKPPHALSPLASEGLARLAQELLLTREDLSAALVALERMRRSYERELSYLRGVLDVLRLLARWPWWLPGLRRRIGRLAEEIELPAGGRPSEAWRTRVRAEIERQERVS